MFGGDGQESARAVLESLRHELVFLVLGVVFGTVGLIAAALTFLSKKFNALLFWFTAFAVIYGLRLSLQAVAGIFPGPWFRTVAVALSYVVPIPAFFYFEAAGLLGRYGKQISRTLGCLFGCLFAAALLFGRQPIIEGINNVVLIAALALMVWVLARTKDAEPEYRILRRGLMVFAAFVFAANLSSLFGSFQNVEPIGFAYFLGTLGYVALHRTLHREQELNEIQKELEMARRIQLGNLPAPYSNSAAFQVATRYVPMTSVAGDFYDFVVGDERQAGLLVADVSGHGVPAALIASMVKLAASAQRVNASRPELLLAGMNATLCGNTHNQFVTAAYVYMDAEAGVLRYAAAAHPPMLRARRGKVTPIEENGLLLAAFSFATFTTVEVGLEVGDRYVLYTDGILEAANDKAEEFGPERLHDVIRESADLTPEEAAGRIVEAVQRWAKSQDDDLTVVVCDYAGGRTS